jgi:hypothetical protein
LEDGGVSVAPPRRLTLSTPSAAVSPAEAVPATSSTDVFLAEAVPATSSTDISLAEAVPAPSSTDAKAIPARSSTDAEAVPAPSSTDAEAIPTRSSTDAEAVPAPSSMDAEAIPAHLSTSTSIPAPTDVLDLEDIHPQGSSRATGGIFRGRVAASYYSPADEENVMFDPIGAAKLTAKIYTSDLDPLNLNHDKMVPSSKVTIKMKPNLGLILDNISQRYPAIKGTC